MCMFKKKIKIRNKKEIIIQIIMTIRKPLKKIIF